MERDVLHAMQTVLGLSTDYCYRMDFNGHRNSMKSLPGYSYCWCVCVLCCVEQWTVTSVSPGLLSLLWTTGQRVGHGIWYCAHRLSSLQTTAILFTVSSGPLLTSMPLSNTHELTLLQANRHTWTQTHTSAKIGTVRKNKALPIKTFLTMFCNTLYQNVSEQNRIHVFGK